MSTSAKPNRTTSGLNPDSELRGAQIGALFLRLESLVDNLTTKNTTHYTQSRDVFRRLDSTTRNGCGMQRHEANAEVRKVDGCWHSRSGVQLTFFFGSAVHLQPDANSRIALPNASFSLATARIRGDSLKSYFQADSDDQRRLANLQPEIVVQ